MSGDTVDKSDSIHTTTSDAPVPGLLLVFTAGRPVTIPIPMPGNIVELGRDHPVFSENIDQRLSRQHLTIRFDGRRFHGTDLGSRNGTVVDGEALPPHTPREITRVVRAGDSLLIALRDIRPSQAYGVRVAHGRVEGPALQAALKSAAHAAHYGSTLHITGETGSGKEGLARAFHYASSQPHGPFVAVNCATIPELVAERLLFGTKRGAYSGADVDADGHLQAAHGGTLFLDEVAELNLAVQAKLLRALETGEVLPLGASKSRKVQFRFCSATHRDLRTQVAAKTLREDLYYRIALPHVVVPPLRDRPEEIPWLVTAELAKLAPDFIPHVSLVESCLLRVWPGNVREILAEVRVAGQTALAAGNKRVDKRHLNPTAGSAFTPPNLHEPRASAQGNPIASDEPSRITKAMIESALQHCEGNISATARELGVHRTQLRRWFERYELDPRAFLPQGRGASTNEADD